MLEEFLGPTKSTGVEKVYQCPNGCGLKLYVNYAKGVYFCCKCGWDKTFIPGKFNGRGSIESLYKYFKCPVQPSYTKTDKYIPEDNFSEIFFRKVLTDVFKHADELLSLEHKEYLQKRGFITNYPRCASASLVEQYLRKNYSKEELLKIKFLKPDLKVAPWLVSGKLLIPYFEYNITTGVRAKSMLENAHCKYIWANNNKAAKRIYNHDLLATEKIVIWTEGEFKAARATECGFPTIATPGVAIGHENLVFNFCRHRTKFVYVCFDTEAKNSKSEIDVNRAYNRADKLLSYLEIPHKRVYIPSTDNTKIDLDTYINENGTGSLGKLFPLLANNNNRLLHRSNNTN